MALESERSKEEMQNRLMVQKGKHQHLSTLMRTVKENIEQVIIEAEALQEESENLNTITTEQAEHSETESVATTVHLKNIHERMKFCKNALRIL